MEKAKHGSRFAGDVGLVKQRQTTSNNAKKLKLENSRF